MTPLDVPYITNAHTEKNHEWPYKILGILSFSLTHFYLPLIIPTNTQDKRTPDVCTVPCT